MEATVESISGPVNLLCTPDTTVSTTIVVVSLWDANIHARWTLLSQQHAHRVRIRHIFRAHTLAIIYYTQGGLINLNILLLILIARQTIFMKLGNILSQHI